MTTLTGPLAVATSMDVEQLRAAENRPEAMTQLAHWHIAYHTPPAMLMADVAADGRTVTSITAVQASDAFRCFTLSLIHLRDAPGVAPALKALPHYTHEVLVFSLDPDDHKGYSDPLPWPRCEPHNVSVQFEADTDDQAVSVTERIAWGMVHGLVPPDVQAYVASQNRMMTVVQLYTRWQDMVRNTAEHHRTGGTHDLGHHHG